MDEPRRVHWCAAGAIGLECTLHGLAAGSRAQVLVCMGSAMAVLVVVYPDRWLGALSVFRRIEERLGEKNHAQVKPACRASRRFRSR